MDGPQAAAAALAEAIVRATAVTHDPGASQAQRTEAVQFFEQLKHGEIHSTVYAAAVLTGTEHALEVQMSAYTLLQILVRNRWEELSQDEHSKVLQLAYQHMKDVGHLGQGAAWPLKSKAAMLLAAVTRQQGPETFAALLPQLVSCAAEGPLQAEVSCMVLQFVCEDLTQFEERGGEWRRAYLAALLASVDVAVPFAVRLLQESFAAGSAAASQGVAGAARAHAAVVSAALGALGGYVEWAPLGRLTAHGVIEACAFFLGVPDFRDTALGVVKQIVGRKAGRDPAELEAHAAAMARVGDALSSALGAMLAAPGAQEELAGGEDGAGGPTEEHARRLAGVLATLADNHWTLLRDQQQQHTLLRHVLELSRVPHLPLAAIVMGFWSNLVKEAGAVPGPGAGRPAAALHSPRGEASAVPSAADRGVFIPPECCELLVQALGEQLAALPVRFDDAADLPLWVDSAVEFKDAVSQYRSQAKLVARAAAKLAPSNVLRSVAVTQQAGLTTAAAANSAVVAAAGSTTSAALQKQLLRGHSALDSTALLLEAVLPSLCDQVALARADSSTLVDGLAALLQQLIAARFRDPLLVTLHARCLEAFSRFLSLRPELLVPLVAASFDCMAVIPLEQSGQLPPPARVDTRWKEEAMARISMAKVLLHLAKDSPAAFLPHLEALVGRIQQLYEAGQLREGERVALHEGLMAASCAGDEVLQRSLLEWLLRPVHARWTDAAWLAQLSSPGAFAAEYMPFETGAGGSGSVTIGGSRQRWALHHELQLFERILRRTPPTAPASSVGVGNQQQQQQQQQQQPAPGTAAAAHPFTPHLDWVLLPVAAIVRALHGLWEPAARASLTPISAAFEMDPVERALRVGGEREAAKRTEEDAGTIAGTNVPALRYWLRGVREGCYMITAYAAQAVGEAFWSAPSLASALPSALAAGLDSIEDRHLRILLRHGVAPLLLHCPPRHRAAWLLPVLGPMLPLMHGRLMAGWAAVAAGGGGGSSSAQPTSGPPQQQQQSQEAAQQQLSDEVVVETLLREVTREYVSMLARAAERCCCSSAGANGSGGSSGGGAAAGAGAAASSGQQGPFGTGAVVAAAVAAPTPDQESVIETLWRHDARATQALVATGVAGMCWPDAPAAGKCTALCRFVAGLAETSHPELEPLLLPGMLRSALLSVVQVSSITIQPEVLHLLRQLLVTWLPRSEPMRAVLLSLPHVTPEVLASFQTQLLASNSEKEQRGLIKSLLAESGGEQARTVLSAVSKPPLSNVAEPRARPVRPRGEGDDARWDWSEAGIAL